MRTDTNLKIMRRVNEREGTIRQFVIVKNKLMSVFNVDCEQSLFSSKIRGKERKTSKRASVTVSVMRERRCLEPLVAWALGDE